MQTKELSLAGLKLIHLDPQEDIRGVFQELYQKNRHAEHGIMCDFLQDNLSFSKKNVLRGLHFQSHPGQAKLVTALQGKIFDVAVDLRPGSATFGKWEGVYLDADRHMQLFIPVGFAHGFCVVSATGAHVLYKVSHIYDSSTEKSVRFDDPQIKITWPTNNPILSLRDEQAPYLKELFP